MLPTLGDARSGEVTGRLESFYRASRDQIAPAMRSLISMRSVITVEEPLLLRAIAVDEFDQLDFAEAYLVARAESTGTGQISSFDRAINRAATVERLQP